MTEITSRRHRSLLSRPAARFRIAFTIWSALSLLAFVLYERRHGGVVLTTMDLFVAVLLSGFAGMLSYFAWLMYVPTLRSGGEDDIPIAKFFAGLATLIPPCVIGLSVLPIGNPINSWFVGIFLIVGCFALLTPHQEYLFARHTRRIGLLDPQLTMGLLPTREGGVPSVVDFSRLEYAPSTLASTYARTMTRFHDPERPRTRSVTPQEYPRESQRTERPAQARRQVGYQRKPVQHRPHTPRVVQSQPQRRKLTRSERLDVLREKRRRTKRNRSRIENKRRELRRPVLRESQDTKYLDKAIAVTTAATAAAVAAPLVAPTPSRKQRKKNKKQRRKERQVQREQARQQELDRERLLETQSTAVIPERSEPVEHSEELRDFVDNDGVRNIEGVIEAVFQPGQKRTYAHVPFAPTFSRKPEVICDIVSEESDVRLKTPQAFSYGTRLELTRKNNISNREIVRVGILARAEEAV